ncbi:unnamed protein product [Gordionus sp. m RMFG-2023]|uniref:uncharacterized protein LOC135931973 n=1 Tax=Gordionus sp. m RMFG-2023 TaxID=3053472 RepID=UPI0030DE37A4
MPFCQDNCLNYVQSHTISNSSKRKTDFFNQQHNSQIEFNADQFPNPKKACFNIIDLDTKIYGNSDFIQNTSIKPLPENVNDANQVQNQLTNMDVSQNNPNNITYDTRKNQTMKSVNLGKCHCFPSWDGLDSQMPYSNFY